MLTISKLADLVGVTPRAIRHYHRVGLLPEPPRRANGYRSYGPAQLIRLTRIRRMQEIGLGLAEIGRLLGDAAEPGDMRAALRCLDEELARRERAIADKREQIAALLAGPDDVTLPPPLAHVLDRAQALGADPADLAREREALALVVLLSPEQVPHLVRLYEQMLGDAPALVALTRRFSALADADADAATTGAEVTSLAAAMITTLRGLDMGAGEGDAGRYAIFEAYLTETLSPPQRRCAELIAKGLSCD
ncbi:MerR family transcriptional regulator [Micromonospora sp. NPDC049679]|uniref:MerR family transcriptional regulator n=1 Tax=Micromonospora sp. NPDC049679 TaxID=3155920 RepID=UPI0034066257